MIALADLYTIFDDLCNLAVHDVAELVSSDLVNGLGLGDCHDVVPFR